jgi:hypothetical protein
MGFAQRFDQWNQRQAARLSPRACGWLVYGILALCVLIPIILAGLAIGGLSGILDAFKLAGAFVVLLALMGFFFR